MLEFAASNRRSNVHFYYAIFVIAAIITAALNNVLAFYGKAPYSATKRIAVLPTVIPFFILSLYVCIGTTWPTEFKNRNRKICTMSCIVILGTALVCAGFVFTPLILQDLMTKSNQLAKPPIVSDTELVDLNFRVAKNIQHPFFYAKSISVLYPGHSSIRSVFDFALPNSPDTHICLTPLVPRSSLTSGGAWMRFPQPAVLIAAHYRGESNCSIQLSVYNRFTFQQNATSTGSYLFARLPNDYNPDYKLTYEDYWDAFRESKWLAPDNDIIFVELSDKAWLDEELQAARAHVRNVGFLLYLTVFPLLSMAFPALIIYGCFFKHY